jgi:hypothetical protein
MENHLDVILYGDELEEKFAKFKSYSERNIVDFIESIKYLHKNINKEFLRIDNLRGKPA